MSIQVSRDKGGKAQLMKLVMAGKVAQASLLAHHAYDDADGFRAATGLKHARYLDYQPDDTQARL